MRGAVGEGVGGRLRTVVGAGNAGHLAIWDGYATGEGAGERM